MLRFRSAIARFSLAGVFCAFFSCAALALDFHASRADGVPYVIVTGTIGTGDADAFKSFVRENAVEGGLVVISSPGGSVVEAMHIGRFIRRNDMQTMVPKDGECFSACFLAFVGGVSRSVNPSGHIGSHQFYWASGDVPDGLKATAITQEFLADIIDYLLQLKIDVRSLTFIMRAPPEDMFIFGPKAQEGLNITGSDATADKKLGDREIILPPGPQRPGCPWPDTFIAHDPFNLNPACKN